MLPYVSPLTRVVELYPGQFGVPGSDVRRGVRMAPRGVVLYVDGGHPLATDSADGTDPEAPLLTIQGAVDRLVSWGDPNSIIAVMPGVYTESVTIPVAAPPNCMLVGLGYNQFWPSVVAAAAATDAITLSARGWTMAKLRVTGGTASAGIRLYEYADPGYQGAETLIEEVFFDGAWSALYGLEFEGAPGMVTVKNCRFSEHNNTGNTAYAVCETATPRQNAYECEFINNWFFENDNHVKGGFGVTRFVGNHFCAGKLIPAIVNLDLRGGTVGRNTVTGNLFEGDYSNLGGYWDHATIPGSWVGNIAEDVAEAEVADNGFTVAPPS